MQSVENFIRKKTDLPRRENSPGDCLWIQITIPPPVLPSANPVNFGLASFHNSVSQFFKIKAPHSPRQTDRHAHTHTLLAVSLENPHMHTVVTLTLFTSYFCFLQGPWLYFPENVRQTMVT